LKRYHLVPEEIHPPSKKKKKKKKKNKVKASFKTHWRGYKEPHTHFGMFRGKNKVLN
jgi:hypothetical protein